jgi:mannose-6-phosphate isomerase-like protein (cupin superfamily)
MNIGWMLPLARRHDQAEEVNVVLSGSGRVKLDDELVQDFWAD